jgi:UV DNA damage endonuclease
MHRTGYCCINLSMGEKFRTMTLAWANRNSKEDVENKWNEVIKHNFSLFYKIISWNIENKIYLYRISSDLVPFADHEKWGYLWDNWRNTIENQGLVIPLREIIKRYISLGGRCSIHPGQFVSIGSAKEEVRNNSIKNLEYHGQLLDLLGLPQNYNCPINIHASNGSKDCNEIANNIKNSIQLLSNSVNSRLVFENEQHGCWTPTNLRELFPQIPITFDYHHFRLNDGGISLDEAIRITSESWPNNDPIQHYSEGRDNPDDPAHSDYIRILPESQFDIEVEAKAKDLAIKDFLFDRNQRIDGILY